MTPMGLFAQNSQLKLSIIIPSIITTVLYLLFTIMFATAVTIIEHV